MSNNNSSEVTLGFGTIELITFIVFFILKLCNSTFSANVSWFWVWFVLWIGPAAGLTIVIIVFLAGILNALLFNKK